MTENIKNKIKETKELDRKIKGLASEIKKDFKLKEHIGYVISDSIKRAILGGLYYIKDDYTYNMVKNNLFTILFNIPDHEEKQNIINETTYKRLLEDFYFNMEYKDEYDCNMSIMSCLKNIIQITEWDRRQLSSNSSILFNNIRHCDNKNKKIICLKLLKNIENLHNQVLETRIINILDKTDNEEKLNAIESLIDYIDCASAGMYIEKFLEYIEIEKNGGYDKNLNEIIKKLYIPISLNAKIVPLDHLDEILKLNYYNYTNKNMELIVKLLSQDIIKMKSNNRSLLFNSVLNMDFENEEFKNLFIKVTNDIILKIDNSDLQYKILVRLLKVKTRKSLELFIDLCPLLIKYMIEEDLLYIVSELSRQEEIHIAGKTKKLNIPINYII